MCHQELSERNLVNQSSKTKSREKQIMQNMAGNPRPVKI